MMLVALLLSPFAASASVAAPPVPPPVTAPPSSQRSLAVWTAGEVRCESGGAVSGAGLRSPDHTLAWSGSSTPPADVTLRFDIDAEGRPVSIRQAGFNDDKPAALAASRFPAIPRQGCSVTFSPRLTPIASAPIADLAAYTATRYASGLPPEGWARLRGEGDCSGDRRPRPLVQAWPDFQHIPATPGVRSWVAISYDIDKAGKPVKVRVLSSNGNRVLDEEGVKAVRKARFVGGSARTACFYRYWRNGGPVAAPAMPERESAPPAGATCPADTKWVTPPKLRFPPAYGTRGVEGWAIVSYDTAPWGGVGNVKVIDAQPSEDFGKQAVSILQTAKVNPSAQGATGCIQVVKFKTRAEDMGEDDGAASSGNPIIFE